MGKKLTVILLVALIKPGGLYIKSNSLVQWSQSGEPVDYIDLPYESILGTLFCSRFTG